MATREEIREGIKTQLIKGRTRYPDTADQRKVYYTFPALFLEEVVKDILTYLYSQGVAIKVEGELPKLVSLTGEASLEEKCAYLSGVTDCKERFVEAGYTAWEPLIEE